MASATYENVASAAEALIAAGQKASVRLVIERIGGGSPNTVLKLLNDWKAGRPVVRVSDVDLDVAITQSIKSQMQRVAETAAQAAEEKAAAALDDLQTLSEASALAEQTITVLTGELEVAKQQASDFVAQMKDEQADHERIVASLNQTIDQLKGELSVERKRSDDAHTALAKAEVRLEVMPKLEEQIAAMQVMLEKVDAQRHDAVTAAAVATAKLDANEKALAQTMIHMESAKRDMDAMRVAALALAEEGKASREKTAALYERLAASMTATKESVKPAVSPVEATTAAPKAAKKTVNVKKGE